MSIPSLSPQLSYFSSLLFSIPTHLQKACCHLYRYFSSWAGEVSARYLKGSQIENLTPLLEPEERQQLIEILGEQAEESFSAQELVSVTFFKLLASDEERLCAVMVPILSRQSFVLHDRYGTLSTPLEQAIEHGKIKFTREYLQAMHCLGRGEGKRVRSVAGLVAKASSRLLTVRKDEALSLIQKKHLLKQRGKFQSPIFSLFNSCWRSSEREQILFLLLKNGALLSHKDERGKSFLEVGLESEENLTVLRDCLITCQKYKLHQAQHSIFGKKASAECRAFISLLKKQRTRSSKQRRLLKEIDQLVMALSKKTRYKESTSASSHIQGLPNTGNSCFVNASLQLLEGGFGTLFNPRTNPISHEEVISAYERGALTAGDLQQLKARNIEEFYSKVVMLQKALYGFFQERTNHWQPTSATSVKELHLALIQGGVIESPHGIQEESTPLLTRTLDYVLGFGEKSKTIRCSVRRYKEIAEGDLSSRTDWKEIEENREGLITYQESMAADGSCSFTSTSKEHIEHYHVLSVLSFRRKDSLFSHISREEEECRCCIQGVDGKLYEARTRAFSAHEVIHPQGSFFTCQVSRIPAYELKTLYGKGELPRVKFQPVVRAPSGKWYAMTGYSIHLGESAGGGHYIAVRLIQDPQDKRWRWHLFDDQSTACDLSASYSSLSQVKVPTSHLLGYDLQDLLETKSNAVLYQQVS